MLHKLTICWFMDVMIPTSYNQLETMTYLQPQQWGQSLLRVQEEDELETSELRIRCHGTLALSVVTSGPSHWSPCYWTPASHMNINLNHFLPNKCKWKETPKSNSLQICFLNELNDIHCFLKLKVVVLVTRIVRLFYSDTVIASR